jgi:hypothetical protein
LYAPHLARVHRLVRRFSLVSACVLLAAGGFLIVIGRTNDRYFDSVIRSVAPASWSPEARVLAVFDLVSDWQYFEARRIDSPFYRWLAEVEHSSPLHLSARSTLTAGADQIGPCGSLTRSMLVLLRRTGIPVRKAILYDRTGVGVHTVAEVWLDGEWRVFDPTYAWYWRRGDGTIATVADLAADSDLFATIAWWRSNYPLDRYTYADVHHLRWEKLPGLPWLHARLTDWLGEERVRAIWTPYLYERPTYMFAIVLAGLGLASLAAHAASVHRDRVAARQPSPPSPSEPRRQHPCPTSEPSETGRVASSGASRRPS